MRRNWSREELMLAINLYLKTPFGKIHKGNPEIIELAHLFKRKPSAVVWKMANFASIDPTLPRKGASHYSKLDQEIWNEFFHDWEALIYQSEQLLIQYKKQRQTDENLPNPSFEELLGQETDRETTIKARVNQNLFRRLILSSYNYQCCITKINMTELLVASHIKPWSIDRSNRLNPSNGLCLNYLHDKAFDQGLITLSDEYKIIVSSKIIKNKAISPEYFQIYQDREIILPRRFLPDQEFLKYHRENIFRA